MQIVYIYSFIVTTFWKSFPEDRFGETWLGSFCDLFDSLYQFYVRIDHIFNAYGIETVCICSQSVSQFKLYVPRGKWTINKTLIFNKMHLFGIKPAYFIKLCIVRRTFETPLFGMVWSYAITIFLTLSTFSNLLP